MEKRLEDYLARHAAERGERVAVACDGENLTYRQLLDQATERASILRGQAERAIPLEATPSLGFIVTYLACHLAGKACVPLERGIPNARLEEIRRLLHTSAIPEEVADILFTTGTTGQSKGAMLSQQAIVANGENLVAAQGFHAGLTFIISGPLNHIGSLSKLWPMLMVGGTTVITQGLKDLAAFYQAVDSHPGPLATFLVPASLRFLLRLDRERWSARAARFEFIETGAAPMSQVDMEELVALSPYTRLYNTYASTETGIVCTHDYAHEGCWAGCLGKPMKHAQLSISPQGTIVCRGLMLMTGYLADPALTASVLRDGRLHTNDLGHLDSQGRLRLTGRQGDLINTGGYKVSPVEVEQAAMAFPGIVDCVCLGQAHPVMGSVLKLIYVPSQGQDFRLPDLVAHLKQRLEPYQVPALYEKASSIHRTYNGKLDRKAYQA